MLGKEEALLVTSGTQGSQISILSHCAPASEVILEEGAHILNYEAGAAAALAGVQFDPLRANGGPLAGDVSEAIREDNIHFPPPP